MNPSTASNSFNSSNSSTTSSSTTHSGGSITDNNSQESNTSSQRHARMVQRPSSSMLQRLDPANESPISSAQTQQLKVLINQLDQLQPPLSSKLTGILNLFNSLKDSEGLLRTLLRDYPQQQDVIRLQSKLTSFVHHFGHALQTTNTHQQIPLNSLQHDDLQACFQGLSACLPVGCTPLFSRPAHPQAQQPLPLQNLIDRLLNRALAVGLPDSVQANGELFDLLNTISRALKAEVLRPEETLCSLFRQSLLLMHDWLGGDQCQRLLSDHNLGRCAVQIATAIRQIPLNWRSALHDCGIEEKAQATAQGIDTWGQLLQSCVLRLCAEPVLQRLASSTPHGNDTISLLNVCNTVKDALDHRLLAPNDAALLPALNRLVMTIGQLPRAKLLGDHQDCRPLANFSNFLRALGESCLQHDALSAALPGLHSACAALVDCIASEDFASTYPDAQALSNLCSFLKFCDKQRGSPQTSNQTTSTATTSRTDRSTAQLTERSLRYAADTLLACLLERDAADFHHTDTLGGLISGLAYLSSRQLFVPSPELNAFVHALLLQVGKHKASDWTDKSKTTLLPALLLMHNSRLVDEAALRPLLPALLGEQNRAKLTLRDLYRESQRVGGIEETVEALPPLLPLPISSTTSSTSTTAAVPATRRIPGDTPIPLTAATSRASFQATPAYNTGPQLLRADNFGRTRDAVWETPKHVAKRPVSGQILVNTEPTVVMLPPAKKKGSPPKAEPTAPDNKDRQASTNTHASSTAPGKSKSPQDAKKAGKTDKPTKTVKPAQTVEAALMAGQKGQVESLLEKKSNWNANEVLAVLKVVQQEVLFYEDAHVGALDRFLALVLPKLDDANRVALGERFKTDRPLANVVDNLLIKHQVYTPNEPRQESSQAKRPAKTVKSDKTTHRIDSQNINKTGTIALHSAIHQGDVEKIRQILGTDTILKLDIAQRQAILQDQDGINALMLAICFGQAEATLLLLCLSNREQQASQQNQRGFNALMYAISEGQVEIAQMLLKLSNREEQAIQQSRVGTNALMYAIDQGQVETAQLLLNLPNAPQQASQRAKHGWTALKYAVGSKSTDLVKRLLKLYENDKTIDLGLDQAQALALRLGHNDLATLISAVVKKKNSPSNAEPTVPAKRDRQPHAVQAAGHINSQLINENGKIPLHSAITQGDIEKVSTILERDEKCHQALLIDNESGVHALILTILNGHTKIVELLLTLRNAQQQTSQVDGHGWNALMYAIDEKQLGIARLLLKLPNAQQQATQQMQAGINALMLSINEGQPEFAEMLLELPNAQQQATQQDEEGFNALIYAIGKGQVDIAQLLMSLPNAGQQASQRAKDGTTALEFAVDSNSTELVERLLKLYENDKTIDLGLDQAQALALRLGHNNLAALISAAATPLAPNSPTPHLPPPPTQ